MKNDNVPEATVHIDCMVMQQCLVVPMSFDLYDDVLVQLRDTVLTRLMTPTLRGVIIDVSGIKIMDHADANALIQLSEQIRLLGKRVVFIGVQAGVAVTLSDLSDEKLNALVTAVSLSAAMEYIQS